MLLCRKCTLGTQAFQPSIHTQGPFVRCSSCTARGQDCRLVPPTADHRQPAAASRVGEFQLRGGAAGVEENEGLRFLFWLAAPCMRLQEGTRRRQGQPSLREGSRVPCPILEGTIGTIGRRMDDFFLWVREGTRSPRDGGGILVIGTSS